MKRNHFPRKPLYDYVQKCQERQGNLLSKFERLGKGVKSTLKTNDELFSTAIPEDQPIFENPYINHQSQDKNIDIEQNPYLQEYSDIYINQGENDRTKNRDLLN